MSKDPMVHSPAHYNAWPVEVISITRTQTFDVGNAIKYILRHPFKGSARQDIEKAMWYLLDSHHNEESGEFDTRVMHDLVLILMTDSYGDGLLKGAPTEALLNISRGRLYAAYLILEEYSKGLA